MKKSNIEKQQKNVSELLELIKENPELRIMPMVQRECVAGDYFGWWMCSWEKASIEEIYIEDENVYIRSESEEELIDKAYDKLYGENMTGEEAYMKAEKIVSKYKWEKVIAVAIKP